MEREQVIRMARESGWHDELLSVSFTMPLLERLVTIAEDAQAKRMFEEGIVTVGHMRHQVAAERNKVASWMMAQGYATGHGDTTEDLLEELDWQITESWSKVIMASVESVREANALLCEQLGAEGYGSLAIAAAIRLKGKE